MKPRGSNLRSSLSIINALMLAALYPALPWLTRGVLGRDFVAPEFRDESFTQQPEFIVQTVYLVTVAAYLYWEGRQFRGLLRNAPALTFSIALVLFFLIL